MNVDDFFEIAIGKNSETPDFFDREVPESLKPYITEDQWIDCYVLIISEILIRIEVDSLKDGVLTYRNRYFIEINEYDYEGDIPRDDYDKTDERVFTMDLKPYALKRASCSSNKEWFDAVFFDVHRENRSTPLFKYLIKDYDAALKHLHLGWVHASNGHGKTNGMWPYFIDYFEKKLVRKKLYNRAEAIAYLKLEGHLEFLVLKEDLEQWNVTEEQLFLDIFSHCYNNYKEKILLNYKFYDGFDLHTWTIHHPNEATPTLIAGLHSWLPECDGEYGSIFVLPDDYNCYVFKFDRMEDLVFSIEFMIPHMKKYYEYPLTDQNIFDDSFYWTKNGIIEKFNASKVNEENFGEVEVNLPGLMADTISRINIEKEKNDDLS